MSLTRITAVHVFFICSILLSFPMVWAQGLDDAIVARVNGEAILLSQLKEAAFDQHIPLASLSASGLSGEGFRRALTQIVDETLLVQKANAEGVTVDDMDISRQIEEMIKAVQNEMGSQEKLDKFLSDHHLSMDALRALMTEREKRGTLATQVVAKRVTVDTDSIEKFTQERKAKGQSAEEVSLAQILIQCPPEDRASTLGKDLYQRALKAAREATANPGKFSVAVKKYTDDQTGRNRGGELGWLDPVSLRPPLRDQVQKMKMGDISPPISTDLGFHVLLLIGRRDAHDLTYLQQYTQERKHLIEQLRQDASIQLYNIKGKPLAKQP